MRALAFWLCVVIAGCSSDHTMLGDGATSVDAATIRDDGATASDDATSSDGATSRADAFVATGPLPISDAGVHPLYDAAIPPHDMAGDVWTGYVEAYTFSSGSDAIRIVFDAAPAGETSTSGVVYFGAGTPPPPATDPNVGYPPAPWSGEHPIEGLAYPFTGAIVSSSRIQLAPDASVVYETWCELQYPVPLVPGATSYGCLPNVGGITGARCGYMDPDAHVIHYVDCGRYALCQIGGPCTCDASSCHATPDAVETFDFHVVGSDGTGTMSGHNIYLTRS